MLGLRRNKVCSFCFAFESFLCFVGKDESFCLSLFPSLALLLSFIAATMLLMMIMTMIMILTMLLLMMIIISLAALP